LRWLMTKFSIGGDEAAEVGKLSDEEIERLVANHQQWLASDGRDGEKFDRPGANLIYGAFLLADLSRANLRDACLIKANLREANLTEVDLTGANLEGASMVNVNLASATLVGANLSKSIASGINMEAADLTEARLNSSNLLSAVVVNCQLRGADLSDINLAGGTIRESCLDRGILGDAKLMLTNFTGTSFVGADFSRAIVFGTIFDEADLSDADLRSAQGLTEEQLDSAYGNAGTLLPESLAGYKMGIKVT
jgi:uncharacterized protein YjbI with pentapeptide repeats